MLIIPIICQKGFEISYETNIPRQAGLSGSSAIVTAALKCILEYYGVAQSIPKPELPNIVLAVESKLGIVCCFIFHL